MRLLYYNANRLAGSKRDDIKRFLPYFKLYGQGVAPVDRSGVLTFPVRMKSLFPLPQMRAFSKTYEELCNERAEQLLARAAVLRMPLHVYWSGGVDSTCVLVSLLKCAKPEQKHEIVVMLSEQSIGEYPLFYHKYISGKLRRGWADRFPELLGVKALFINGECNDQLFGSDIIGEAINKLGLEAVLAPYSHELFTTFVTNEVGPGGNLLVKLFEQLKEAAPVPLKTNYDMFWWINFALKWQTVYMRMLSFVNDDVPPDFLPGCYDPFFNTEDFQLWSMNNIENRLPNGWRSYKWQAKDVIYKFTKDAEYRDNKTKRGSLQFLIPQLPSFDFIDENFWCDRGPLPDACYDDGSSFA